MTPDPTVESQLRRYAAYLTERYAPLTTADVCHCAATATATRRPISRWRLVAAAAAAAVVLGLATGGGILLRVRNDDPRRSVESVTAAPPSEPAAPPEFTMPDVSFSLAEIPPGFTLRGVPESGPGSIPGTTTSTAFFVDEAAGQQLVVTVLKGIPVADLIAGAAYEDPQPSSRRVRGYETYTVSYALTAQRGLLWIVDQSTAAYVIGSDVADADLFRVAEAVHVRSSSPR